MLKHGTTLSFSIAAACFALLTPGLALAENPNASTSPGTAANSTAVSQSVQQEAAQMVPAQARLVKTIDAQKAQAGGQFEAVVDGTVRLKDGTELPHGTVLIGKIAADQMHPDGTSRLALRFTEAKLKDGKTLPIRAMIAGVAAPSYGSDFTDGEATLPTWSHSTLQVDEIGALNHVDLHSRIAGQNSGVFIATKKDNVKLAAGSQLSLAIAVQGGA